MRLLITLIISLIALYAFIKRLYTYTSIPDTVEPPIDYESDKYKEAEVWFTGMGRC